MGEADHGIITTYDVLEENPSDTALLKPAVRGHRRPFRKRLKAVAGDRGFYSQFNEDWLKGGGIKRVSITKRGKVGEERHSFQKQSWFKRLQLFRAGFEARISLLKRKFGLKRSCLRGSPGIDTWVGQCTFTQKPLAGCPNSIRYWRRRKRLFGYRENILSTGFPLVFQREIIKKVWFLGQLNSLQSSSIT